MFYVLKFRILLCLYFVYLRVSLPSFMKMKHLFGVANNKLSIFISFTMWNMTFHAMEQNMFTLQEQLRSQRVFGFLNGLNEFCLFGILRLSIIFQYMSRLLGKPSRYWRKYVLLRYIRRFQIYFGIFSCRQTLTNPANWVGRSYHQETLVVN